MKVVVVKEIEKMPIDCDSCPFQGYDRYCGLLGEYTMLNEWVEDAPYYDLKGKGDCPLKPMPNKLDANDWHRMFGGTYKEREAKGYGWNACLDEILGEKE